MLIPGLIWLLFAAVRPYVGIYELAATLRVFEHFLLFEGFELAQYFLPRQQALLVLGMGREPVILLVYEPRSGLILCSAFLHIRLYAGQSSQF